MVELYYTFEPIWTNLLTHCTQLPASGFLLFLFFRFSGYLKCPKNSGKIILKISDQEAFGITKGEKRDHHQGARRVPGAAQTLGRARHPPGCPGWPLDAPLHLYNPLGVETPKQDLFSAETSLFRHHHRKLASGVTRILLRHPAGEGLGPPGHLHRLSFPHDAS